MSRRISGPRVVIISGPDGSGKTTQARILVDTLRRQGANAHYRWIRFVHLLSLPLLVYATTRKYTHYELLPSGRRVGYHTFWRSKLMSRIYPCLLYLDMVVAKVMYLDIPTFLFRRIIVCDRFAIDAMVDIMTDTRQSSFHESRLGHKFLRLTPRKSVNIVLITDLHTILTRRSDLVVDRTLSMRTNLYTMLARDLGFQEINGSREVSEIAGDLRRLVVNKVDVGEAINSAM